MQLHGIQIKVRQSFQDDLQEPVIELCTSCKIDLKKWCNTPPPQSL